MIKKTLLSTTALLVAAGIAAPAVAGNGMWTISAGVQSTQLEVESDVDSSSTGTAILPPNGPNLGVSFGRNDQATDIGGELALGYQYNFNRTYNVALEAFGQLNAANVQVANDVRANYEPSASMDWVAGLRLRPGYYVTPSTRLFLDGGVVLGGFEVEQQDATVNAYSAALKTNDLDKTDVDTLWGWRYGVGAEHEVMHNFMVGVDYTVTQFATYDSQFYDDVSDIAHAHNNVANIDIDYTPTLHTLGLNFKYLFGAKKQKVRHHEMRDK